MLKCVNNKTNRTFIFTDNLCSFPNSIRASATFAANKTVTLSMAAQQRQQSNTQYQSANGSHYNNVCAQAAVLVLFHSLSIFQSR